MRLTVFFVLLQYIAGFFFALAGIWILDNIIDIDLGFGIGLVFLSFYISMLAGVAFAGYFHLRTRHIRRKFSLAMSYGLIGLLLFFFLGIAVEEILPIQSRIIYFILPLTGAVFGFNYIVTTNLK
jgi:hypothetical protein